MEKELRENQALNAHMLSFDCVQKKMEIPTFKTPIDPAAGAQTTPSSLFAATLTSNGCSAG